MTPQAQEILKRWQVRKTKQQKTDFIHWMKAQFPELKVEEGGSGKSRNLVLGDVEKAQVVFTGHYDTCARLPFPNFITPKNFLIYLLYQLLICIPFFAIMFVVTWGLRKLGVHPMISVWAGYFALMGSMFYVLMGGPANPHTANDNTSGIITLIELYAALTPEQRSKAAFVFFDNEENGLLGSAAFAKKYKKLGIRQKLLVNFDCVSDGDNLMLVLKKKADKQYHDLFARCFQPQGRKQILLETTKTAFYPSDQANFDYGVGVAALKHKRGIGYYMDKIHTPKDTVFDEENIALLVKSACALTEQL